MFNNRIFYNAVEAYQMASQINHEREQKQLDELYDRIDSNVKAGLFELELTVLSDFQKNWLLEHGFEISEINAPGSWRDRMIKVSWEKPYK